MAGYSQSTLVRQVRDILGEDVKWQTLATAANAADTTIDVTDGTDWNEGDILEWVSDGDQAYVQSVSGNVLTVIRGVNGTTAATHAGTAATKNPTVPYLKVTDSIDACINTLWPWAWKVVELTITPSTTDRYFEVSGDVIDLVAVWQEDAAVPSVVRKYGPGSKPVRIERRFNNVLGVTQDTVLAFPDGFWHNTNTIYVQYRTKLIPQLSGGLYLDLTSSNYETATPDMIVGANAVECVAWGAAARLMRMQPAVRLRNDARQYQQVDVTDVAATADFYWSEYKRLLNDVHDQLMRTHPPMRTYTV